MGPSTLFLFGLLNLLHDRNLVYFRMEIHFAEFIGHPAHNGLQMPNSDAVESPNHETRDGCARSVQLPFLGHPYPPAIPSETVRL
jgi:hypothetical protein